MEPSRAAELAARKAYGRLLASVASRTRDIAAAEDALAEAFVSALTRWPRDGVPDRPEAWLLTAARRRALDGIRRRAVRDRYSKDVEQCLEAYALRGSEGLPDDRMRLLFACTHPAIDAQIQAPLMLQTVLGLDAKRIASVTRVAPKTVGQRLWRAKRKIRNAGIAFEVPEPELLPERLHAVLEAVYAAFGVAWEDVHETDPQLRGLTEEALFLGRLLAELLPDEPEALGLLSLMLFAEARRDARREPGSGYVPLPKQDPKRWSKAHLEEAEALLRRAFSFGRIGPYQLEGAIQSAHVSGRLRGKVDHLGILALYEGLVRLSPTLGAQVGRAAVLVEAHGAEAGLRALEALDESQVRSYQPWWAVRAEALRRAGRNPEARMSYERAAALSEAQEIRSFLLEQAKELDSVAGVAPGPWGSVRPR